MCKESTPAANYSQETTKDYYGLQQDLGQMARNDGAVHQKLMDRKWKLESELREVEAALKDLSDPAVQKILNVITVAEKR